MRDDLAFILRRFASDLPWMMAVAVVILIGFVVGPVLFDDATAADAAEMAVGLGIALTAVLPMLWLRPRNIRALGGRRTAIAATMAILWAAAVLIGAWPYLTFLDTAVFEPGDGYRGA